jgi:hypothetical protein
MDYADRERALQRGRILVNLGRNAERGSWTPVKLDAEIIGAAEEFRSGMPSGSTSYR